MGTAVSYGLAKGEVWGNEDASAVAVWFPPGQTTLSTLGMLRAGMIRLPLQVGLRGSVRVLTAIGATEPFHKQVEGPHWYLLALGTRPERQGQGLGSALMEIGTARADAARIPPTSRPPQTLTSPSTANAASRSSARRASVNSRCRAWFGRHGRRPPGRPGARAAQTNRRGFRNVPLRRTIQCRCGPVEWPVLPS